MRGTWRFVMFVLVLVLVCFPPFVMGEISKGRMGVGVNYPGVGFRYLVSDKVGIELKAQTESNILVGGLRGYYYFLKNNLSRYALFGGLEADYTSFKGSYSEGTGFAGELFVGGEYFFANNFSLQVDLGPAMISLNDKETSESVSGLEYVVNFGINYYWGK